MDASEYLKRLKENGRNDPCPCGSGKKYKKCHLPQDEAARHEVFLKEEEERKAAAPKEEGEEKTRSSSKPQKNIHERSGKAHNSAGNKSNLPRRGAI